MSQIPGHGPSRLREEAGPLVLLSPWLCFRSACWLANTHADSPLRSAELRHMPSSAFWAPASGIQPTFEASSRACEYHQAFTFCIIGCLLQRLTVRSARDAVPTVGFPFRRQGIGERTE